MRETCVALAALLLGASLYPIHARADRLVLLPEVGGDAPSLPVSVRRDTMAAVLSYLETTGHDVRSLRGRDLEELRTCADAECAATARAHAEADIAIGVAVFRLLDMDGVGEIVLSLYAEASGPHIGRAHLRDGGLSLAAAEAWVDALRDMDSGVRPTLYVVGEPQGASVLVDDEFVGTVDYHGPITPGAHTLEVRHDGFQTETRSLQILEGGHVERVPIALERIGGQSRSTIWAGWALPVGIGAIIAGVGLGVGMPLGSELTTGCIEEIPGECIAATRADVAASIGWAVAGAVLTGVGITLVVLAATEDGSTVRAHLGPTGPRLEGSF